MWADLIGWMMSLVVAASIPTYAVYAVWSQDEGGILQVRAYADITQGFVKDIYFTSDKGGGKCFCPCSFVCLSICLLARLGLLKNACVDLDEMLRVDRCRNMEELINC